jgi:hypothetical protein
VSYPGIRLDGLRKTTKNFSQNSRCPGQSRNALPLETGLSVFQHILDTRHEYGTIEVLYIGKKGRTLDTQEKFHIYQISKHNLQLNDNFAETTNPIYDIVLDLYRA